MGKATRISAVIVVTLAMATAWSRPEPTPNEPVVKPIGTPGPAADVLISAASAIVMDEKTGKVLWSREPDTQRFPASTTKILTALLLVENTLAPDVIVAPKDVELVTGSSLHLKPGEKVSSGDLLKAILLRSANDACYTVAVHIAGSQEAFSKMMNERAKRIGCRGSAFNNPHGLNDDKHLTTARDLALITREALKHAAIRDVVSQRKATIQRSSGSKDTLLVSKNHSLELDPTADGVKTGWTKPAGKCFIGSATRGGHRVITVVLKSEDWVADNQRLLDWAFDSWQWTLAGRKGDHFGWVESRPSNLFGKQLRFATDAWSVRRIGSPDEAPIRSLSSLREIGTDASPGDIVGTGILMDADGHTLNVPVELGSDAQMPGRKQSSATDAVGVLLVGAMLGGALALRRKARR